MKKITQFGLLTLCIVLLGNLSAKAQTTSLFFTEKISSKNLYEFTSTDVLYTSSNFSTGTGGVCNGAEYRCQFAEFILELKSTSASAFVFYGTSSASSGFRSINKIEVSDTKDDGYAEIVVTKGATLVGGSCDTASISGINIPQGKFVKITFSGNINLSCIEITPASSSDVKYVLTTNVQPDASAGTIVLNPTGTTVDGGVEYAENISVTLTATPSSGYEFVRWADMEVEDTNATNPERTISMTEAKSVTAVFELEEEDVTAPQLASTSPADGGVVTLFSTTTGTETVTLTFDEAVQIVDATGITVNGTPVVATLGNNGTEITFNVDIDIDDTETYIIAIAVDAIKDLNGNSLAATSFTFTAKVSADAPLLHSLTSSDIATTTGKPDWISLGARTEVDNNSYGVCVGNIFLLKVDKNKKTQISLERCGRLVLALGTNAGVSASNILTLTVQVGDAESYTKIL